MNSLQQELNNINQQLEHLNARKAQLEPIISEYSDVIERVKNLVSNMIDVNVEPSNLMFDIQDLVNLEDEPDTTPEPQPGQDFPTDWMQTTTEAHLQQSEPTETEEQPEDFDTFYPELTPEPTPQPVKMFAFIPFIPGLPPGLTQEPTPEPTPEPDLEECSKCEGEGVIESSLEDDQICPTCGGTGEKPELEPLTQINMQAYRRQNNTLLIGFTSKRLMNAWEKWFIKSTPHVKTSNSSDRLQGFNYCLTLTWDTDRNAKNWEYLAKLNYSLKPTEQNRTLGLGQVASSEEE